MKTLKILVCILLTALVPRFAMADLVGPYTADANTLFLFHFDEAAGGTVTINNGSKAGNSYSVNEATASATPATVTTMLGAAGYVSGPTNFNGCMTNPTAGYEFGYDYNNSGAYQGDVSATVPSADALLMTNFNIGNGGVTPFTLEALVQPAGISSSTAQEIICTDNSGWPSSNNSTTNRGFQFRIISSTLNFQFVGGASPRAVAGTIPTTGADAFVPGTWYHVAAVYDRTNVILYWTKLDGSNGAAHQISSGAMTLGTTEGAVPGPLIIGNENRNNAGERFIGSIDEVRISSVARAANQMQFFSPLVTITLNPVSQNIDYNQAVTFNVSASSQTALGYQWRFNSNSIPGATGGGYTIPNVAAANKGYYDVIVTNTAGFAATSSPALLIVGAANFLNHRYSFTTDASDSVGTANGVTNGDAVVTGGSLVLDGTAGTYMQLPAGLFTAANSTALTVEFWAAFGVNANFVRVFDFGNTNVSGSGVNYVGFSPRNGSGGHQLHISPSDGSFQQTLTAAGTLDGLTRHIACVIDPPNKTLAIYTNGVLEGTITNLTVSIGNLNDTLSYVGRSLFAPDPYLNASIDELRLYNGALSGISIKQSDDQGPNTVLADGPGKFVVQPVSTSVPAGQIATFTAAAIGYLPISYQWFKNGTPVPGATNSSYSFATVIGDNNASILVHATNTIGVTTYVTNSVAATLTVFVPPTLAWLDTANGGADNSWNTTSPDWTNDGSGGGVIAFTQTNGVLFDNRGSGSSTVDIGLAITPYNVNINASSDYIFTSSASTGSLVGQAGITKQNSGKLTIDLTNNLTGPVSISAGTLQVGNGDGFGTLGSGPVTNNATLSLNRNDAVLNVGNAIHGTGTLSVDGSGSVTISGNSDFSGSTLLNAGIVFLTSATGLGSTSAGTVVSSGGQLYVTANVDVAEGLTIAGSGPDGNGALRKGGAGLTVDSGAVALSADSTIGVDAGATLVLSNTVSGPFALMANGTGTLTLSKNNTIASFTLNGPVVNVNSGGALGSAPATISGAGRFVLADGLNLANAINAPTVSPGAVTGLIMVNDNTNGTVTTVSGPLTFGTGPANGGDFVGPTTSGYLNVLSYISAPGLVTSVRLGNVRFSGGGDYIEMQVRANTTSIGANNGVATNAVMDIGGNGSPTVPTYFDLNGFNQRLGGLKNTVTPANLGVVTNSGATVKTLTLDLAGNSYSFSGAVAGNVALVLNSGTENFTGTNTYTGNTTINGGTLELATASIASNSTVTIASGAFLQLDFATTNTVGALVLAGTSQSPGVYNSTTSPSFIASSGSLLVVPPVNTAPTNVIAKVNGGNLELSWPADHTGWRLQVQTNSLAGGLNTNWVDVPNATAGNSVTNALNPRNGTVFYRMIYP